MQWVENALRKTIQYLFKNIKCERLRNTFMEIQQRLKLSYLFNINDTKKLNYSTDSVVSDKETPYSS